MRRDTKLVDHIRNDYLHIVAHTAAAFAHSRAYGVVQVISLIWLEHEPCRAVVHDLPLDEFVVAGGRYNEYGGLAAHIVYTLHKSDNIAAGRVNIDNGNIGRVAAD